MNKLKKILSATVFAATICIMSNKATSASFVDKVVSIVGTVFLSVNETVGYLNEKDVSINDDSFLGKYTVRGGYVWLKNKFFKEKAK